MQSRILFLLAQLMLVVFTDAQPLVYWSILTGSESCSVASASYGTCITDGIGEYGNDEVCTIRAEVAMSITATEFVTESGWDLFTVGATAYSGSTGPTNVQVAAGTVVNWSSDDSNTRAGWTICANLLPVRLTTAGCTCAQVWTFNGQIINNYCGNPDRYASYANYYDPYEGGDWCNVADPQACQGNTWGECAGAPPRAPPPSPSPPPTLVTARNDPHFRLPHGGRADIRGEDGAIYNLLSAKNVSLSALFEAADFTWSKRSVHGTKMAAAFWVIRTYSNDTVTVSYTAAVHGQERYAIVSVVGAEATDNKLHVDAAMPFKLSNLAVTLVGRKLIVETDKWQMAASADPFPFAILNKGKVLMNIEVTPKYDADKDVVAPHGIFGQAYDDDEMAVNGAIDSPTGSEWTTKAQGEGAIEGSIAEYKLADGFSTDFKYSRFDAVRAPHRDVSKLTGPKEKRGKGSSARVEHYAEPEPSAAVGSD